MSGSLGFPGEFDRDDVQQALQRLEKICLERNFPMGYHVVLPSSELFKSIIQKGYKFVALSTDFYFLGESARNLMKNRM